MHASVVAFVSLNYLRTNVCQPHRALHLLGIHIFLRSGLLSIVSAYQRVPPAHPGGARTRRGQADQGRRCAHRRAAHLAAAPAPPRVHVGLPAAVSAHSARQRRLLVGILLGVVVGRIGRRSDQQCGGGGGSSGRCERVAVLVGRCHGGRGARGDRVCRR